VLILRELLIVAINKCNLQLKWFLEKNPTYWIFIHVGFTTQKSLKLIPFWVLKRSWSSWTVWIK